MMPQRHPQSPALPDRAPYGMAGERRAHRGAKSSIRQFHRTLWLDLTHFEVGCFRWPTRRKERSPFGGDLRCVRFGRSARGA